VSNQELITSVKGVGVCSVCDNVLTKTDLMNMGELRAMWGDLKKVALISSPLCATGCKRLTVKMMVAVKGKLFSGDEVFS